MDAGLHSCVCPFKFKPETPIRSAHRSHPAWNPEYEPFPPKKTKKTQTIKQTQTHTHTNGSGLGGTYSTNAKLYRCPRNSEVALPGPDAGVTSDKAGDLTHA